MKSTERFSRYNQKSAGVFFCCYSKLIGFCNYVDIGYLKHCNNDNFFLNFCTSALSFGGLKLCTYRTLKPFFLSLCFICKEKSCSCICDRDVNVISLTLSLISSDEIGGCSNYCTVLIHTRRKEYRLDIFNQTGRCPAQSLKNFSLSFSLLKNKTILLL